MKISQQYGLKVMESNCLFYIGQVLEDLDKNEEALKLFNSSLTNYNILNNDPGRCCCYIEIGRVLCRLGDKENAGKNFNLALIISCGLHDNTILSALYDNMGIFYKENGDIENAITFLNNASGIYDKIGNKNRSEEIRDILSEINKNN